MKIKNVLMKSGTLLVLLLCNAQHLGFAQGTAFTHQGRLNDGSNLANGSYDLRLALFDAAVAGMQ